MAFVFFEKELKLAPGVSFNILKSINFIDCLCGSSLCLYFEIISYSIAHGK